MYFVSYLQFIKVKAHVFDIVNLNIYMYFKMIRTSCCTAMEGAKNLYDFVVFFSWI